MTDPFTHKHTPTLLHWATALSHPPASLPQLPSSVSQVMSTRTPFIDIPHLSGPPLHCSSSPSAPQYQLIWADRVSTVLRAISLFAICLRDNLRVITARLVAVLSWHLPPKKTVKCLVSVPRNLLIGRSWWDLLLRALFKVRGVGTVNQLSLHRVDGLNVLVARQANVQFVVCDRCWSTQL